MSDEVAADARADAGSGFVAGFSARHEVAPPVLARALARPRGFAPADVRDRIAAPAGHREPELREPPSPGPRHFAPADRATNPTAGWNPLDPGPATTPAPPVDNVAQARAAGYAEGLAAAQDTLAAALAEAGNRDRALLGNILDQLAQGRAVDREGLATQLRQTVLLLVGKVVGETGVSPDLLAGRVTAAVDHLADRAESALLRVHPDDVALLDGRLPATVFAAGDAGVARGSFVLETASTIVEDGPALWLDQLAQAVDRVALPPAFVPAPAC